MERRLIDITDLDIFSMTDEDIVFEIKHREPTDAIPVEWIVKRVKEIEREWDYQEAVLIADELIANWRKENGLKPIPTISERLEKTIPVEWLEHWFNENVTDYCYAKFDVLIKDWRKEIKKRK